LFFLLAKFYSIWYGHKVAADDKVDIETHYLVY